MIRLENINKRTKTQNLGNVMFFFIPFGLYFFLTIVSLDHMLAMENYFGMGFTYVFIFAILTREKEYLKNAPAPLLSGTFLAMLIANKLSAPAFLGIVVGVAAFFVFIWTLEKLRSRFPLKNNGT